MNHILADASNWRSRGWSSFAVEASRSIGLHAVAAGEWLCNILTVFVYISVVI